MTTIGIVTCTETGGIGINGLRPWGNLFFAKEHFEERVGDNPVIIGKASFLANQKFYEDKAIFVLSNDTSIELPEYATAVSGNAEEVLAQVNEAHPGKTVYIAGGEAVYETFWNNIDEWYVTIIEERHVFDKEIRLAHIYRDFPVKELIGQGTDSIQDFSIFHFTKE